MHAVFQRAVENMMTGDWENCTEPTVKKEESLWQYNELTKRLISQ
jgi:hypothetical protein